MTKFKIFKEEIFILWELHSKILVGDTNEFRHFRPHYLDVDAIFGDLGVNVYQS